MIDVRRADMHTHTLCSDGVLSPEALVRKARDAGLTAISITDHDTAEGIDEAEAAAGRVGLEVIPGVELSVSVNGDEIHLLGYFFDRAHAELQAHLRGVLHERRDRAQAIVRRLNALGLSVSMDDVLSQAKGEAIGRPHIAAALLRAGHVTSEQEAFNRYLGTNGAAYVPRERVSGEDAVDLLHRAGGVAVLAHPGHWMAEATIRTLVQAGLDGIETVHPAHDEMLTRYYSSLGKSFGLLASGGSDFHGRRGEGERLGHYSIPYPYLERLRERSQVIRAEQDIST